MRSQPARCGGGRATRSSLFGLSRASHLLIAVLCAWFVVTVGAAQADDESSSADPSAPASLALLARCSHAHVAAVQREVDEDIRHGRRVVSFVRASAPEGSRATAPASEGGADVGELGEAHDTVPASHSLDTTSRAVSRCERYANSLDDEDDSSPSEFTCTEPTWPYYLKTAPAVSKGERHQPALPSRLRVAPISSHVNDKEDSGGGDVADVVLTPKPGFRPIRLKFDVTHLYASGSYCSEVGQIRSDFLVNENVSCTALDIFTEAKRDYIIKRILPVVEQRVKRMFSVKPSLYATSPSEKKAGSRQDSKKAGQLHEHRLRIPDGICGRLLPIPPVHTSDGVAEADIVIYALAAPVASSTAPAAGSRPVPGGGGRTIAWSGYCGVDETGRPAVARMNFVPRFISPYGPRSMTASATSAVTAEASLEAQRATVLEGDAPSWWAEAYVRAVLHETFHTLGFAPPFFAALERGKTGAQLRQQQQQQQAKLTTPGRGQRGGSVNVSDGAPPRTLPTSTALPQRTSDAPVHAPDLACTAPLVVQAARAYFNCGSVTEVLLENDGGKGTAGAHWERRLLRDEVMAGTPSPVAAVSSITAAFFHSLPFYSIDGRFVETMQMRWGRAAGCEFAESPSCVPLPATRAWGLEAPSAALTASPAAHQVAETAATMQPSSPPALLLRLNESEVARARSWCLDFASLFHHGETLATADGTRVKRGSASIVLSQCSGDRRGIGQCAAVRSTTPRGRLEGQSVLMDGCPVVETTATLFGGESGAAPSSRNQGQQHFTAHGGDDGDVMCTSLDPLDGAAAVSGHFHGTQSRCAHILSGTARSAENAGTLPAVLSVHSISARCLRLRCPYGRSIEVQVGGVWVACPEDGSPGLVSLGLPDSPDAAADRGGANVTDEETAAVAADTILKTQSWLACEDAAVLCDAELFYMPPPHPVDVVVGPAPQESSHKDRGGKSADRASGNTATGSRQKKGRTSQEEPLAEAQLYPAREVVVTLDLSIKPRRRQRSGRSGPQQEASPAMSTKSPASLPPLSYAQLDWPGVLAGCPGATIAAVETDLAALLRDVALLDSQPHVRNTRQEGEGAVGRVAWVRVIHPTTALVTDANSTGPPQTSGNVTSATETPEPSHGTRRRRLHGQETDAAAVTVPVWPAWVVARKDSRALVFTFTLAVTVTSPAQTQAVLGRLRAVLLAAVGQRRELTNLTALALKGSRGREMCESYAASVSSSQGRAYVAPKPVCVPPWLLGSLLEDQGPASPRSAHGTSGNAAGGGGWATALGPHLLFFRRWLGGAASSRESAAAAQCLQTLRTWSLTLRDVRVRTTHDPPLVLDSPPVLDVTAAADVWLTVRLEQEQPQTPAVSIKGYGGGDGSGSGAATSGSEQIALASGRPSSPILPRGAAWLLTPDATALLANGLRDDVASLLRLTTNLISVGALSLSSSAPGTEAVSVFVASATVYAPSLLDASVRHHTRAAWQAALASAMNGSLRMDNVGAAAYRVLHGVGVGAAGVPPTGSAHGGVAAYLIDVAVSRAEPLAAGGNKAPSTSAVAPASSLPDTRTDAITRSSSGKDWPDSAEEKMSGRSQRYCFRLPRAVHGGVLCADLSVVLFALGFVTIMLAVVASTAAFVHSAGSEYEDVEDEPVDYHSY